VIDIGLLLSIAAMLVAADLLTWFRPMRTSGSGPLEVVTAALLIGVLIGRLTALALDDPDSMTSVRDLAVIRGGVEFWPGLAGGLAVIVFGAWRSGVGAVARVADLAPYGLVAAAAYQATCAVREGCYGPGSPVGLALRGSGEIVVPVEIVGALALTLLALLLVRVRGVSSPAWVIVVTVTALAVERSISSFWLPVVGDGPSRQHIASIVVAVVGDLALLVIGVRSAVRSAAVVRRVA
jgi:hypothetical protein